jgi:hypothetical protein
MTLGLRTHSDQGVEMVEAARHLVALILAARDEGEQIRRVPPRVAEALAESGLLQNVPTPFDGRLGTRSPYGVSCDRGNL